MRDDEGKWDKEQQHLDDHHHDLWLDDALANCEHEHYTIEGIDDETDRETLSLEISCDFCEKLGTLRVSMEQISLRLDSYSTHWPHYGVGQYKER